MSGNDGGAALVTGAGKRIGRAIALHLAARGWDIAVHYGGSAEAAEAVAQEIRAGGGKAAAMQADLTDAEAAQALVPRTAEALGPLTCLVNNASLFELDHIQDFTVASWDRHQQVNLRAPMLLTQAFAAQVPPEAQGNVINLLDQRVWRLTPHFLSYTASKAALWAMTQSLALALAPGIRVNGIGPGPALASYRQTPAQFAEQCRATPLGHGTSPEEICRAVAFILEAPSMTGQMIALDSGQHLAWRSKGNAASLE